LEEQDPPDERKSRQVLSAGFFTYTRKASRYMTEISNRK
jgi:hypothetical protein